jgi:hypothetical protein
VTLITSGDKTGAVTVQTRAAATPQHAFKVNVPTDLSLVFKGWGPFPAVRGVENQTGAWDHVGAFRYPVLSDGTTANETLTEYTVGQSFSYEVTSFTNIPGDASRGRAWRVDVHTRRRGNGYSLDVRIQATSRSLFTHPPRTCSAPAPLYAGRH